MEIAVHTEALAVSLAVLAACVAATARADTTVAPGEDHPTMLVESLRRRLMLDNYEYLPSDTEELFPIKHELDNEDTTVDAPTDADRYDRANQLDSAVNDHFIARAHDLQPEDLKRMDDGNSHAIAKDDLLYYVDDARLSRRDNHDPVQPTIDVTDVPIATTTAKLKYKVLKVGEPHANRRSQSYRRFIQEEGAEGVAIINLDSRPFPEFRLPRARRQYMMDRHDYDSQLEVAPASDPEDDVNNDH